MVSYRSAVSRDHTRPAYRTKRKRIGNEIDLNEINTDLVYVSLIVIKKRTNLCGNDLIF